MGAVVDILARSMRETPEDWDYDEGMYCVVHKTTKHEVWVGNGFWFYGLYAGPSGKYYFNFFEKIQFGRAYSRWMRERRRLHRQRVTASLATSFGLTYGKKR